MGNINHVCCRAWLSGILADGEPHNVESIRAERKKAGYTKSEVKAAKKSLGIISFNDANLQGGAAQNWFWQLPSEE